MNATLKNERGVTLINRFRLVRFNGTQLYYGQPLVLKKLKTYEVEDHLLLKNYGLPGKSWYSFRKLSIIDVEYNLKTRINQLVYNYC